MAYLGVTVWISLKRNYPREKRATLKEIYQAFLDSFWTLILPIFIIGSILTGIATPTESAAISAVYALLVGLFIYKTLNFKNILNSLVEAAKGTTIVMLVVCSASIFTWLLIREGVPTLIAETVLGLGIPDFLMMAVLIAILFFAGMFMDLVPNLFIFIPIFYPIVESMGGDLIHFSIVMLCSLAMGLFTPPVGSTLFISCHIAGITIEETIKDLIPFFIAGAVVILIVAYNPGLALWLPNLLFK
jgi:tripartite ATP-independent transporter DctM subunit